LKSSKSKNENSTKASYWASHYVANVGEVQKPQLHLMGWRWQLVCLVNGRKINLKQFSCWIILLNVAFEFSVDMGGDGIGT